MQTRRYQPGFRISYYDVFVLFVGTIGTGLGYGCWGPAALLLAFVVAHFFLFCNVFRIARGLELIWAGVFTALAAATVIWELPGWRMTIGLTLATTLVVILVEMRKPSYHGAWWRRINPRLPEWWESQEMAGPPMNPHPVHESSV